MTETPRPVFRAARERSALRSLARFTGLSRAAAATRRGLVGTRERATLSIGGLGTLVVALVAVVIFVPAARPYFADVIHAPGGVVQQIAGSGPSDSDADKAYPRLYSVKLGVDVAVKAGDGKTPPVQPIAFQYPNTAPLGKSGNTYLYAHDRPGMFLGLHRAQIGDILVVATSPTEKIYFQVTEIHANVAWNDLEWLRPTSDIRLTLQTCNFSGDYDPRYVVVTHQVSNAVGIQATGGV